MFINSVKMNSQNPDSQLLKTAVMDVIVVVINVLKKMPLLMDPGISV